ncbi:MAG: Zn-dependent hydrolase [Dehalococcoidia bacterium]|nr:Zn-dependent hydrolase [Dehalococcoidia bacterium]
MDISWLGHACVRLRAGGTFVIMDPTSKEAGYDMGRPTADVVTVSHDDPGHNNVKGLRGEPLLLDGPGEYEVQGVQVLGIASALRPAAAGEHGGRNVVFVVEAEELRVAHLGALRALLTAEQKEQLGTIDVLIIPVSSDRVLDVADAARVVRGLEPKVVIPIYYAASAEAPAPVDFVRALGIEAEPPVARITLQKRGLSEKTRLVILEPRA